MGDGPEAVTDEAILAATERQAARIRRQARWWALAAALLAVLIPGPV
ncbi:MAG: hypothetical protein P8188_12560 [Gemmatimonadota bacterium]|jgi:hypothetical protein